MVGHKCARAKHGFGTVSSGGPKMRPFPKCTYRRGDVGRGEDWGIRNWISVTKLVPLLPLPALGAPAPADGDGETEATPLLLPLPELRWCCQRQCCWSHGWGPGRGSPMRVTTFPSQ